MRTVAAAALVMLMTACVEPAPYVCAVDADCTVDGVAGKCNRLGVCEAAGTPLAAGRLCLPGVAIGADEDPCAAEVCTTRPWCCSTGWSETCVHAAETACEVACSGLLAGAGDTFAGAGTFDGSTYDSGWTAPASGWVFVAEWGDYDGDGHGDLAVGREQLQPGVPGLVIYPWNPGGTPLLGDPLTIAGDEIGTINALEWMDYGNDGRLDLIAAGGAGIFLVLQDEGGAFTAQRLSPLGVDTIAWIDDDGAAPYRLVVGYSYIEMEPEADIPPHVIVHQLAGSPPALDAGTLVGDIFNGDLIYCQVAGGPARDILVGGYPAFVLTGTADGGFDAPAQLEESGYRVECADMDRDGDDDVVLSGGNEDPIDLFLNDAGITKGEQISPFLIVDGLDVGDVDGDHDLDIITSMWREPSSPMTYLRNDTPPGGEPQFFILPADDWNGAGLTAYDLDLGPAN